MDTNPQKRAQDILDAAVARGEENGAQFCVYRDGECLVDACAGWRDFDKTASVDSRTVFPVYSTSKGVPAAALTRLIEEGRVSPEIPVGEIWPEFAQNGKEETLVLHCLNHTTGLPQRFAEQDSYEHVADWPRMIAVIEACRPDWKPGTKTRYQSLTYGWVTGELIQRVTGRGFRDYVMGELFAPAGIGDFWFGTTPEAEKNAAEIRLGPGQLKSKSISICDPLDDLMRQPVIRRAALPGFNAIASARGLAKFYDAVLRGAFFSRSALDAATTVRRPEPGAPRLSDGFSVFGLGFALSGPAGDVGGVFGHGGYGGSDALADKSSGLAVGFTSGVLGEHPCKAELYDLVGLKQRQGWEA